MRYLLDTSVIVEFLRGNPEVIDFISSETKSYFTSSTICEAEIYDGVFREKKIDISKRAQQVKDFFEKLYTVIPFDSVQAQNAGKIRAELSKKGAKIDDLDVLIAAAAIVENCVLWTKNPKHFSRIENLEVKSL